MDVEKTIQFLLKEAARNEARWAKSDARLTRLEGLMAQNNRAVVRLVRYGVSLRSDVRRLDRAMARTNEQLAETNEKLAETDDKLKALIDTVDRMIRRNGGSAGRT